MTDTNGCRAVSTSVNFTFSGLGAEDADPDLSFYPNPSAGLIFIAKKESQDISISVFDELGRNVVAKQNIGNGYIDLTA
ncbi:T9SS type A sorting domain-containing protein, partial [Salmonella enterica]|uniref:T9SS type A sorting domain-containing protein n=1 Tax=Salmonella enterica TaxID=28901 RepID=UPI003D2B150D